MNEDSDLIEFPKKLAAIEHARSSDARKHLLSQQSSSLMWLIASLLALNSGGLFLLKDVKPYSGQWVVAGFSFYLGTAFALAVGWLSQRTSGVNLAQVARAEAFWATVTASGQFSPREHARMMDEGQNVGSRAGRWFALLSFVAFSAGLFASGCLAITSANTPEIANAANDRKPPL